VRIINIGCWSGKHVKELLDRGHDAYGADIDTSRFLSEIKDRLFKLDITKPLPQTKPFDEKFDLILFEEVLEHLEEGKDLTALKNIYSLLKNGGTLCLTTPKSIPYMEDYDPAWIKWKLGFGARHYHYPMEELFSKISAAGFKLEKVRVTGNLWWLFCRWVNLILKYLFRVNDKHFLQAPRRRGYFGWMVTVRK